MSTYIPTDWVDGTTPLDAAHFDNMEAELVLLDSLKVPDPAGLDEKWLKVEGGAMVWVDPPAGGGGGSVEYENAWGAATAYQPGDVVEHEGVQYLAVNPSTNSEPSPVATAPYTLPDRLGTVARTVTDWNDAVENGWFMGSGAANAPTPGVWYIGLVTAHLPDWVTQEVWDFTAAAANPVKYVRRRQGGSWNPWVVKSEGAPLLTSLPSTTGLPDGAEVTLTDSLTAPTYAWRLRYVLGIADSYKWLFVGGSSICARYASASEYTFNSATFANLTNRVFVTVPRYGEYEVAYTLTGDAPAPGGTGQMFGNVKNGDTPIPNNADSIYFRSDAFQTGGKVQKRTIASGTPVFEFQAMTVGGAGRIFAVDLVVRPVRLA